MSNELAYGGVCPVCGDEITDGFDDLEEGESIEKVRLCVVEKEDGTGGGLAHLPEDQSGPENRIEVTDRQRERLDEIKAECTGEGLGNLPEPTDQMMLSSLLDTWDAAGDGHYSRDVHRSGEGGEDRV